MTTTIHKPPGHISAPVSLQSNWATGHSDPKTADNSGNRVVDPASIGSVDIDVREATTLMFRHKYVTATPPTTSAVVQAFGFDANDVPMELYDVDGTHELTLTVASSTDLAAGSNSFTPWKEVDCRGCKYVKLAIKVASAGGTGTEVLQVKLV